MKRLCVCVTAVLGIGFSPIQLCVSGIEFSPIQLCVSGIGFPPHTAVRQWHRGFPPYIYVLVALRFSPIHLCVIGIVCFLFCFSTFICVTVALGFSPYISVSVALGFSPIHLYVSGIGVFLIQLCVSGIGVFPIQLCQSVNVRVLRWTLPTLRLCGRGSYPFLVDGGRRVAETGACFLQRDNAMCILSDTQQQQQQRNKQTNL